MNSLVLGARAGVRLLTARPSGFIRLYDEERPFTTTGTTTTAQLSNPEPVIITITTR